MKTLMIPALIPAFILNLALTVLHSAALAAPGSASGPSALALAAVIAQHSPAVRAFDKRRRHYLRGGRGLEHREHLQAALHDRPQRDHAEGGRRRAVQFRNGAVTARFLRRRRRHQTRNGCRKSRTLEGNSIRRLSVGCAALAGRLPN
jgi:hypothetical protein